MRDVMSIPRILNGKLAVITGGSSGIGYAIAQELVLRGARALLVARDVNKLEQACLRLNQIRPGSTSFVQADVSLSEDIARIAEQARALSGAADLLINSAGIVSAGLLFETPIAEWDRLHNLNVRGLVQVLQALVPDMIAQAKTDKQARHIINIASAAGYSGSPGMSAYGATKAAVIALSESLRAELAADKIGVTAICPGFVITPIAETVQLFGSMDNPKTRRTIEKMFAAGNLYPEQVARVAVQAIQDNKFLVSVGREAVGAHWLKRLSPRLLARVVAMGSK